MRSEVSVIVAIRSDWLRICDARPAGNQGRYLSTHLFSVAWSAATRRSAIVLSNHGSRIAYLTYKITFLGERVLFRLTMIEKFGLHAHLPPKSMV